MSHKKPRNHCQPTSQRVIVFITVRLEFSLWSSFLDFAFAPSVPPPMALGTRLPFIERVLNQKPSDAEASFHSDRLTNAISYADRFNMPSRFHAIINDFFVASFPSPRRFGGPDAGLPPCRPGSLPRHGVRRHPRKTESHTVVVESRKSLQSLHIRPQGLL
jgi:hypothetical protein